MITAEEDLSVFDAEEHEILTALEDRFGAAQPTLLVKTVGNKEWDPLLQRFESGPFATPTSLLPRELERARVVAPGTCIVAGECVARGG